MKVFAEYLAGIDNAQHRARTKEVLGWVMKRFPDLVAEIKWNQPMFMDHGTFIIGFSTSRQHLAVAPERAGIIRFSEEVVQAGYGHSKMLIRFPWDKAVDFPLLERIIEFNISEKANCSTFWRK